MTQSAQGSEMVTIKIRKETHDRLKKLKTGKMTYDDVISSFVDEEKWDVEKLDADLDKIEKKTKYHSFEEVFKGV